jgi:hypothetical protein
MPPGTDQAINAAMQSGRGYEAVVLVVVFLGLLAFVGFVMRQWILRAQQHDDVMMAQAIEREKRLSDRVSELEKFIREELLKAIHENGKAFLTLNIALTESTATMARLIENMNTKNPCMWSTDKQREVIASAADRIAVEVVELVEDRVKVRSA